MKNKIVIFSVIVLIIIIAFISVYNSNKDSCKKISNSDERNNCYQASAIKAKSLKICDKIEDNIKNSCYWNIARLENNISICEKILLVEDKEWCYHEIAQINNNSSICNMITSNESKTNCISCLRGSCSK